MNIISETDKPIVKKTVVVYAGRFQPFHKGHYAAYKRLVDKFGQDSVYIGTSNDTNDSKSPFNFNEKKKIATTMFGIPSNHFVNIKNPYKPVEILKGFDGKTTQYIAAVGEKDAARLRGKYFKPYQGKAGYGYEEIGYVWPVPAEQNPISGTDVRKGLGGDEEGAKKFFLKAYPKFNKEIFQMITDKMKSLHEVGTLGGPVMAVDFGKKLKIHDTEEDDITEDGFPGGVFTGLVSPGGYINGAPKPKDVQKTSKKLHKNKPADTNKDYVYDPISEIVNSITDEDFDNFIKDYLGEDISKTKANNIKSFVEYASNKLKLKDKPTIKLIFGSKYSKEKASLGGYVPETKDIVVVVDGRMTADICRTIAHELVHRKQDELGLIKDEIKAGKTGSPIENQANSIAGILLRNYGKINKKIYSEGLILENDSDAATSDQPNGAFIPKGHKRVVGANDGVNKSDYWFHNGGYIQLEYPEADGILGDDDANQIYIKYVTKNVPRESGPKTKFTTNPEKVNKVSTNADYDTSKGALEKILSEVGKSNIHFKNIYKHWRDGSGKQKQSIAALITGNPFANQKEFVRDLSRLNKNEIEEIESVLGIGIETINEMGRNDIHFKNIYNHYRDGDTKMKQKIAKIITGNASAKIKEIVKDMREMDHNEIEEIEDQIGISLYEINKEDISVDVNTGDEVLMGKFKNKKVQVKDIGKDQHGMPTINGKQATTFRTIEEAFDTFYDKMMNESNSMDGAFNSDNSYRSPYFKKWEDWDKRGDVHADIVGYKLHGHTSDSFKEKKNKVVLPSNNPSEENGPGKRWIHPSKGNEYASDKKEKWEMYPFNSRPQSYTPPPDIGKQIDIFKYTKPNIIKENIEEWNQLLLEGGAYGHMSHPFDDMDLTFGDLKDIISKALDGDLGVVREKTDGQALAISWKNGRLIAARNKGHLQNAGENAMGIEGVASKFANRGGLTDAYNYAMNDLNAAVTGLSKSQRDKIFQEGKCFMNIEVIWPTSVNVIPYGQALLVFHNTTCYDESGKAIGADQSAARTLAGMIKQINADVQSQYTIQGPPITSIPKNQNLSSLKTKYLSKLSKLQSEFGLSDNDTISLYHQSWWENFIDTKAPVKVDKMTKEALVKRWAFGDKSFKLNTISNEELVKWAIDTDKISVAKQQKDNIRPFEEIFLGVGADILSFVSSVLTVHPDKAIRNMKDRLKDTAEKVRTAGSPAQIQKLKMELERLKNLGGVDRIVAAEGLVFFYGGKTYKLTGTFAPLNQILGIFY